MTTGRDWYVPVNRDLCQHPRGCRQGHAHIKWGIGLYAVSEIILKVVVNPEGGPYRPLAGPGRIPGQPNARLQQDFGIVLRQAGRADQRIRLEHAVSVENVIGTQATSRVASISHVIAEPQTQAEMPAKFP